MSGHDKRRGRGRSGAGVLRGLGTPSNGRQRGDIDICLGVDNAPNLLYANDGTENHWLKVRLAGVESNSFGVNAKVRVVSGGSMQVREMLSSRGHQQDPYELAFGLGEMSLADSVVVYWPSGNVDVLTGVSANQGIKVVEGSNPVAASDL